MFGRSEMFVIKTWDAWVWEQNQNVTGVSMYDNSRFLLIKPPVFQIFQLEHIIESHWVMNSVILCLFSQSYKPTTWGSRTCPHIPLGKFDHDLNVLRHHKLWFFIGEIIPLSWPNHSGECIILICPDPCFTHNIQNTDSQDLSELGLARMRRLEDWCRKWWLHGYLMGISCIYIYTYTVYIIHTCRCHLW